MNSPQKQNSVQTGRLRAVGLFLFLLLLPVWPVEGLWFGLPAWAVLAVAASCAVSVFIAFWIQHAWPEEEPQVPVERKEK